MRTYKQKRLLVAAVTALAAVCAASGAAISSGTTARAEGTSAYKYTLVFEDDFNGEISQNWSLVSGGSSYKTESGEKGWYFNGEDHIRYKNNFALDTGKFLYGTSTSTDYVFEVKMRADVNGALGEYSETTLNTMLPFFVTNSSPDSVNYYKFYGRSVCITDTKIGFYESDATNGSGWVGGSVAISSKFSDGFDWREWHTIRVEATQTECNLWLDGVLVKTAVQSDFTKSTTAAGPCGFSGKGLDGYAPLGFDDFKYWERNESYDPDQITQTEVRSLDTAGLLDRTKIDYISNDVENGLSVSNNAILYNTDGAFGTDIRLLKDYGYQSLEATLAFDIERQKAAKGVTAEGSYTGSAQIRTSDLSGVLFNGSFTSGKYNGYLLNYFASYYQNEKTNTVTLALRKLSNNSTKDAETVIGKLSDTTSCVVHMKVADGYLYLTVYATETDYENGTKVTLTGLGDGVSVDADLVYKVALTGYDAETGGDYTEGYFGFRCNAGSSTGYTYDAKILSFEGKGKATPATVEPTASVENKTLVLTTPVNGSIQANGKAASGTQTLIAHSDVKLTFAPAKNYVVDNVKINGVDMGAITEFTLRNITKDYRVEVTFTNVKKVEVYILAGQSNAAGYTPTNGLYKAYTYGGTLNEEKIAEYENGYKNVMYYGVTKTNDPTGSYVDWDIVRPGKGMNPTRIGPELGFAETMSQYYGGENGKAAVIKYAVGSTGFILDPTNAQVKTYGNWYSPTAIEKLTAAGTEQPENTGLLYTNLLQTFRQAIQALVEQGYEPVVKGAFWMQGCEDSKDEALANAYQDHLTDLINDLRRDVTNILSELSLEQDCSDMPFVIGKIGADLQKADYEGIVREQMQKTAAAMQNVRIVESDDYILPDPNDNKDAWHFSAKGSLGMGNRFADVLAQMTGKKEETKYTVTFDANGGSVSTSTQTVSEWMTATEPTAERAGYILLGWYETDETEAWSFTANGVKANVTLKAQWQKGGDHIITVITPENGSIGVEKTYADTGETVIITVTSDEGYQLVSLYVNGKAIEGNSFVIESDSEISATFEKIRKTGGGCVSATFGAGSVCALFGALAALFFKSKNKQ